MTTTIISTIKRLFGNDRNDEFLSVDELYTHMGFTQNRWEKPVKCREWW